MVTATSSTQTPATAGASLLTFTWNLNGNIDALTLACKYLEKQGSSVAALQELPAGFGPQMLAGVTDKLKLLTQPVPIPGSPSKTKEPTVALVASKDIDVDPLGRSHEFNPVLDSERRIEGRTLVAKAWTNLQVLSLHAWDRLSRPSPSDRTQWAVLLRNVLASFWSGGPLIVLGDLNANPWDEEVADRQGLFAIRAKDWPVKQTVKLAGVDQRATPLYNPMWQTLPDDCGTLGTLHFSKGKGIRWNCFDQIIVSSHLREHLTRPEVCKSLDGRNLVGKNGTPLRKKLPDGTYTNELSDHLPVQMTIDLSKVKPCRVSASS